MITVGSLFSGIGVFDAAAHLAGMKVVWQVEINKFGRKVLAKHFPDAKRYSDIYECHNLPHVDVLTAGFPCQDFSLAGKRLGENGKRYLIPELLRVIGEVKPYVCVFENVPGFPTIDNGNTFRKFLRALADFGYDAEWSHLFAEDFGAGHRRERWFCIATLVNPNRRRHQEPATVKKYSRDALRHSSARQRGRKAIVHASQSTGEVVYPKIGRRQKSGNKQRTGLKHPTRTQDRKLSQSRLGRTTHGFAGGVDGFGLPIACPNEKQYGYEPPRLTTVNPKNWSKRVEALGNAIYAPVVIEIMKSVKELFKEEV